jgi:hypothetical protein
MNPLMVIFQNFFDFLWVLKKKKEYLTPKKDFWFFFHKIVEFPTKFLLLWETSISQNVSDLKS